MTLGRLAQPLPMRQVGSIALGAGVVGAAAVFGLAATRVNPLLVLAGAASMALGVMLLRRPDIGAPIFLALLWLNVPAVLVSFHDVPSLIVQASLVLLLIPVAAYILRREPVIITPALVALLAYLAANMISAAASSNVQLALDSILSMLGEGLLIYLLISNAIRTPQVAAWSIGAIVVASVIASGLAIHQQATGAYDDPYLGFAQNTSQQVDPGERFDPDRQPRMAGPIGEQNRFAQNLLVALPMALFGLQLGTGRWARIAAMGAGLVIVAGVLLTFSRGAAVALAALAVVMVARRYVRMRHMLGIIAALILTALILAPSFITRVESIGSVASLVSGEETDADGAILGRTTSNVAALLVFVDYPIVGVGPGVYPSDYSVEYANRLGLRFFEGQRQAHNMYLEWAAETGILGLVTGLALMGVTYLQLTSLRRFWLERRKEYADLAGALALGLMAYGLTAVFLHLSYERFFFALLATANSVIWVLSREREALDGDGGTRAAALPEASSP